MFDQISYPSRVHSRTHSRAQSRDSSGSTQTIISDSLASSTVVESIDSRPSSKPSEWLAERQRYSKCNRIGMIIVGGIVLSALFAGLIYWIVSFYAFPPHYSTDHSGAPYPTPPQELNTTIIKNANLHQSFYGLGYTPSDTQYPTCGATQDVVLEDMKVLSQLTTRLRLYGMDCQAANYTLNAIRLLNVNMTALLTLWVDDNDATYERQYNTLFDIIEEYGSSPIEAVSVGNEVIYRNQSAASSVVEKIQQLRDEFARRQIRIPVTTTDLANLLDQNVISSEDIVMANIHPFFGGVNVSEASNWTMAFDKKELVKPALAENKTETVIAEVGWPTSGEANQDSVPSVDNLQFFVNDFVCDANKAGLKYYFFEAFDEPWKRKVNELEGSWGIMDENRNLKVTIPVC